MVIRFSDLLVLLLLLGYVKVKAQPNNDNCFGAIPLSAGIYPLDFSDASYSGICDIDCMLDLNQGNLCSKDLWYKLDLSEPHQFWLIGNQTFGPIYMEIYTGSCNNLDLFRCGSALVNDVFEAGSYLIKISVPSSILSTEMEIRLCKPITLDPIDNVKACDAYRLPLISGINLSGNQAYYTGQFGAGTKYLPGDMISTTQTLYAFDSNTPYCRDQEEFNVIIATGGSNISSIYPNVAWFNEELWHPYLVPDVCDRVVITQGQTVWVPDQQGIARCKTLEIEAGADFTVFLGAELQVGN